MKRTTKKVLLGALKALFVRVLVSPWFIFTALTGLLVVGAIFLIIGLLMLEPVLPQA